MAKKIFCVFLMFMVLFSQAVYALEPPLSGSVFGKELASAMAARSRVAMLSRVVGRLGPYGLLASIAIPAIYDWVVNDDGTVSVGNTASSSFPTGSYYAGDVYGKIHTGSSVEQVGYDAMLANESSDVTTTLYWTQNAVRQDSSTTYTFSGYWKLKSGVTGSWPRYVNVRQGTYTGSSPTVVSKPLPSSNTGSTKMSVEEAISKLTQAQQESIIPAQKIADALNKILDDQRIQAGGVDEPYFTAAEVEAIRAKTGVVTRVGDLGSPLTFPDLSTVQKPDSQTQNTTPSTFDFTIPPSNVAVEKLNIPATYTPTLFAAASGCPAPISFSMFGKTYNLEYSSMCSLMQTVSPLFITLGAMAAALIFARSFKT